MEVGVVVDDEVPLAADEEGDLRQECVPLTAELDAQRSRRRIDHHAAQPGVEGSEIRSPRTVETWKHGRSPAAMPVTVAVGASTETNRSSSCPPSRRETR